jgi:LPXTG-motif cell wall-anchored protein
VLAGAEFRLTDSNGKTLKTGLTTDGSGQFVVTDLAPGKYFFIETKAPEGYKLDDTPIPFIIEKGQAKAVEITATNEAIRTDPDLGRGSGAVVNKNTGNGANETKPLPKTGDTNDIASMVAGAALLLTGGIIIVLARRRRSH